MSKKLKLGEFDSEAKMVRNGRIQLKIIANELDSPFSLKAEVRGPGSIPDLVLFSKKSNRLSYVISLEFKLSNWNKALCQAFAQRNFCNESYVVLDYKRSSVARSQTESFKRFNVGLATLDLERGLEVWSFCTPSLPFSEDYSVKFSQELLRRKTPPKYLPYTKSVRGGYQLDDLKQYLTPLNTF